MLLGGGFGFAFGNSSGVTPSFDVAVETSNCLAWINGVVLASSGKTKHSSAATLDNKGTTVSDLVNPAARRISTD